VGSPDYRSQSAGAGDRIIWRLAGYVRRAVRAGDVVFIQAKERQVAAAEFLRKKIACLACMSGKRSSERGGQRNEFAWQTFTIVLDGS